MTSGAQRAPSLDKGRPVELAQIRHFVAVMERGSFTAAAERCGVSQPGITKSVRALERELGGPLFHREGNRLYLTELGRTMAPILQRLEEQARLAYSTAERFEVLQRSSLRLGILRTVSAGKLAPAIAAFRRQHPGVDVEIHQGDGETLGERLDRADLDLLITNGELEVRDRQRAEVLYAEPYRVAFASEHRFAAQDVVRLEDLVEEAYIDRLSCEYRKAFQELCASREVSMRPILRTEREDWVQEIAATGLGVAILPAFGLRHPGLLSRPLVDPELSRQVSLVRVRGRRLSNAAARLRAALRDACRTGTASTSASAEVRSSGATAQSE
jgi:DNA-binding transcriptional LysR family regulator